jgi:RNA methyltransferase, TrmH family
MTALIGARHPTMQRMRRLTRRRSARSEERAFVIEGPTLVYEVLAAQASGSPPGGASAVVEEVLVEPDCPAELAERAAAAGATVRQVAAGGLARVTDAVTPQPAAAIARIPDVGLDAAVHAAGPLALVLVAVGDPGNGGTLLRSAEAAGAGAVLFCDGSVDPFGPKCVRSSAGSLFRLAVVREAGAADALRALRGADLATVGTVARDGRAYDAQDLSRPTAVVLGNEAHGLPDDVAGQVDEVVTIPMAGRTESLNVGMAGTILCFESLRQRRAGCRPDGANQLDATPGEGAGCTAT